MFKNFFSAEAASVSHGAYPLFKNEQWDGPTYIDQKNKFQ